MNALEWETNFSIALTKHKIKAKSNGKHNTNCFPETMEKDKGHPKKQ